MGYKVVLDTIDFHCVDKNRNIFKILFLFFTEKKLLNRCVMTVFFFFGGGGISKLNDLECILHRIKS